MARYLEPLATRTPLRDRIRTSSRVTSVGRLGFDKVKTKGREAAPFEVRYQNGKGPESLRADAVIDATGTWLTASPAGADGRAAIGETKLQDRIAYGMPDVLGKDRARYAGKTVAVLGAGHSAIGTLIDLARLGDEAPATPAIWLLRGDDPQKAFGGGANDKLAARGALGAAFAALVASGKVTAETGFKVSHLAPLIDPNLHSCGTVRPHGARELAQPDPGFYFAGIKSYGRAPTFLMLTGYEQVRSIVAEIAGDHEAARKVELVLPETGVCSGPAPRASGPAEAAAGCCGGPQADPASGCCVADVEAKAAGKTSCGCG